MPATDYPTPVPARRPWIVGALVFALAGHLLALYLPGSDGPPLIDIPGIDKVVHVGLFAVPAFLIRLLTRAWWPLAVLALHAPVSELVQYWFVPLRSGDPLDMVADCVGIALGWWLGRGVAARWGRTAAESSHGWTA